MSLMNKDDDLMLKAIKFIIMLSTLIIQIYTVKYVLKTIVFFYI